MLGAPPVRVVPLAGALQLPPDKRGTLLLNDVDALALADQIALYDWLGTGAGNLRVISVTTSNRSRRSSPAARFSRGCSIDSAPCSSNLTSREGAW